jgi:DNA-binding response OmpR family regulator
MILLVDDEPSSMTLLEMMLKPTGSAVRRATSGKEALSVLAEGEPCVLVISDIRMPEMDGRELVARMRSNRRLSAIPVIIVTEVSDRETVDELMEQGVRDYIVKPYDAAVVLTRVRAALADEISIIELRAKTIDRLRIGDREYASLAAETGTALAQIGKDLVAALRAPNAAAVRAVAAKIDEPAARFGGRRAVLAAHRTLEAETDKEAIHFGGILVTEIGQLTAALQRVATAAAA